MRKATPGCGRCDPVPSSRFLHARQVDSLTLIDDRWDLITTPNINPVLPAMLAVHSLLRMSRAQHTRLRQQTTSPRCALIPPTRDS